MKSYFSSENRAFGFLLCFVLSGILPVTQPILGSGPAGRTGHAWTPSERTAHEDQKALEAYEKRNAEITRLAEDATRPNHDNAALLYYQAFLLLPEVDWDSDPTLGEVYRGTEEPDKGVRTFLGKCLPALEIYEAASHMPQCKWGLPPENQLTHAYVRGHLVDFSHIVLIDARTLAADGKYSAALEQCLAVRRFARHLREDPELYRYSKPCDDMALRIAANILGVMPPDADVLAWFQGQLALIQLTPPTLERELQRYFKAKIHMIQAYSIRILRGMLLKRAADERAKQHVRDSTDQQIRAQAIETVHGIFGSVFAILHSDTSGDDKYAEIEELTRYTPNSDIFEALDTIHNHDLGEDIFIIILTPAIRVEREALNAPLTQKEDDLSRMHKIIDKRAAPHAIELLKKASNAFGEKVDLGFLADSEMTDEQRLAELEKVICQLSEAYIIETSTFGPTGAWITARLESQLSHAARVNSIKAAVELYLILAKTGQLPEKLPDYLPKDPFTGRDFLYEITGDTFDLACQSDIFDKGRFDKGKERFSFRIQKREN